MIKLTPIVSRSKSKCYKAQKVQKYALQALQILTNDDEVENWRLSSFLLAVLFWAGQAVAGWNFAKLYHYFWGFSFIFLWAEQIQILSFCTYIVACTR